MVDSATGSIVIEGNAHVILLVRVTHVSYLNQEFDGSYILGYENQ